MSKQKKSNLTRAQRTCRSLLILMMSLASLWGLWQIVITKPAMADDRPENPGRTTGTDKPSAQTVEKTDTQKEDGPYQRRENCWTFLLVGMDRSGGNTDSLMLVTYDVDAQSVSVGSIARDTRVDVERKLKKINAAYAMNGGIDGLIEEVSKTFGVPVDYYFRVNLNGFVRLVNAVDGVDFEVPCSMNYDDPEQNLSIHYSKGMQHLNGQQALEVCRFRQNNGGAGYGDEGRQQTQRALLTAVMKKALSKPEKIGEYAQIAAENLDTNLPLNNLVWFATKALSFNTENLHTMSMPCHWINPYMYLDPVETLRVINEFFNPYTTPRTADQLDIITR